MDGIDSLKFDVLLVDDKYKQEIDACIDRANKLNKSLTEALGSIHAKKFVSDAGVKNAEKAASAFERIRSAMASMPKSGLYGDADALNKTLQQVNANLDKMLAKQTEAKKKTDDTAKAQQRVAENVKQTNSRLFTMSTVLHTITQLTGVYFGAMGIRRFLSSMINITGQFEVQRMALRSILRDIDGADKIFQDLYRFSSDSTYRFSELAKYAKQLAAFNIDQNNLLETTKMLGDVASGVGVSMDRLILAYGHVKSSGFLRGIQLRSFSQNGVPVLEELSKILSEIEGKAVSLGDVFDRMMKRQIPFKMVEQAFKNMTTEGGKFYKMQEVLAKTLAGQINILKGRWENMLAAIGDSQQGILKGAVQSLSKLVLHYDKLGASLVKIISLVGIYKASMVMMTLATKGYTLSEMALLAVLKAKEALMSTNPYTALALAITAVAAAVWKLFGAMKSATEIQEALSKEQSQFAADIVSSINELDLLYSKLKLASKGTKEYNDAVLAIQSRYGSYITQLRNEGVEVNNLADIYDNLRKKIEDAARARFIDAATASIDEKYGEELADILDKNGGVGAGGFMYSLQRVKKQLDLNAKEEGLLKMWVGGFYSREDLDNLEEAATLLEKVDKNYISLGNGDSGPMKTSDYIDMLSKRVQNLNKDYNDAKEVITEFAEMIANPNTNNGVSTTLEDWRKTVRDLVYTLDQDLETTLMPKQDEDYMEYLERVGKHYKEINEYKDKALEKDKHIYEAELDAIKKVDAALEGNILKDVRYTREPWNGGSGSSSDPFAAEITKTRAKISILEKFKGYFDRLESVFGEDANAKFEELFPDRKINKVNEELEELLSHLETLGDNGKIAAESIRASLGLDKVSKATKEYKELEKRTKAVEKAQKELDKWKREWGGNYSGFDGELEKALNDYINENLDIDNEYNEALKEAAKTYKDDAEGLKKYTDELERYYRVRKTANYNTSQNNLNELASKYVKNATNGMSLTDWGDKSLSQVFDIWETLNSMTEAAFSGDLAIDEKLAKKIQESGFTLEEFSKLAHEEFQKLSKEAREELLKKVGNYVKEIASIFKDAASSVQEFAEAAGNMNLAVTMEELSNFADLTSSVVQKITSGDLFGAAVSMFSWYTKIIFEAEVEAKKFEAALAEVSEEARRAKMESALAFGTDGIFGGDSIQGVRNSINLIRELQKAIGDYSSEVSSKRFFGSRLGFFDWASEPNQKFHYTNLKEMAKAVGGDLYDAYDNLNADTLQTILETYENLDTEQRAWIKRAIGDSEAYARAMEQIEETTKNLFDNLASDMADKFIDNFLAMGNAVDDLSDTFANLGDAILRSFLQSYILEEILNKYSDDAKGALSKYAKGEMTPEQYAAWLDGFAENVQKESETLSPAINGMIAAFKDRGLMNIDEDTANSLGNGIKGITEDTASLLASYINAIRADVSYIRVMQERGWENINAFGQSLPTLSEYIAQVSANTYDTAQNTNRILSELQSVIGAPGTSGMVVRVEYA